MWERDEGEEDEGLALHTRLTFPLQHSFSFLLPRARHCCCSSNHATTTKKRHKKQQNKADETSSAFQKELARRASGGRGPAESSSSRSGDAASRAAASRPRWAPDAIRGAQQPPPSPPPSMNRGGPVPEQLQASRDLVNEGLSGLIPRAKVLLTVGAAVPTAFGGLIAVAVCVFAVLALGLEDKFIHGAL